MQHPPGTLLSKFRSWWEHRVLFEAKDWIQVEITSRCNAFCSYCPRTIYQENWQDRSMPLDMFERLVPVFRKTSLVYLQGWGEPFLHPDFPAMIHLAKAAGCTVGATSNGMLLTRERMQQVMEAGLDILAFSLAGTTPEQNDPTRSGTSMSRVLETMDLIRQIKQERQSTTPAIHIAYMLLRQGLDDLEGLPRLMAAHGVEKAVVSVLDFEPGMELSDAVLTPQIGQERRALEERFLALEAKAAELGMTIHTPGFEPKTKDAPICAENIQHALFIAADGSVSPCVYANVPVDRAVYTRQGQAAPYKRITFGNILHQLLPIIWRGDAYACFRQDLTEGRPAEICRDCPKRVRYLS